MKKSFNVIQIKGFRGILYIAFIGICLAAGFGWFPGWICMNIWNYISAYTNAMPVINIFQGILLWGIIAVSYFVFRKEKHVVCMKASEELSEEELKAVFANIKQQMQNDIFVKNMFKAHEAELRIRNLSDTNIPLSDINISKAETKKENIEKIETK